MVAVTTVLFNLVIVFALLVLPAESIESYEVTFWLASAITAAGIVQLLTAASAWIWPGKRWRRTASRTRDQTGMFFKRALPGLIATGTGFAPSSFSQEACQRRR